MFFLDTNILVDFLRGRLQPGYEALQHSNPTLFKVPALVKAELLLGAQKSRDPVGNRACVERLLAPYSVVPFDAACSYAYARIRAQLEEQGCIIGPNDLVIAATVHANNGILVTNNAGEFERVEGLAVETWEEVALAVG